MRTKTTATSGCAVLALLIALAQPAAAQTRLAVDGSAGWVGFPDDGHLVSETLAGVAARYYVGARFAVGPELVFIQGDGHSHLVLTGNLSFDLRRSGSGHTARTTPFVVVGGGLYQTREQFLSGGPYTSREGAFTAGGGVRVPVGQRGTVGVEARMGWEAHLRLNAVFGWQFGGAP
jgi:hypothetical protein